MRPIMMGVLSAVAAGTLGACGEAATSLNRTEFVTNAIDAPEDNVVAAVATPAAQASPVSWAGKYELQPAEDDTAIEVKADGSQRYNVEVTWGGFTASGAYNTNGWLGVGVADGPTLRIQREGESPNCRLTLVGTGRAPYRLSGCGGGDGNYRRASSASAKDAAATPVTDASWLVGAWAPTKLACAGDSGITFDADGTYVVGGESGRWELKNDTLIYTALQTLEMGSDEPPQPIANPTPAPARIMERSASRMKQRYSDGSVHTSHKCPN